MPMHKAKKNGAKKNGAKDKKLPPFLQKKMKKKPVKK